MTKVFLHGLGQTPKSWEMIAERLDYSGKCLIPDLTKTGEEPLTYGGIYSRLCKILDGEDMPLSLCGLSARRGCRAKPRRASRDAPPAAAVRLRRTGFARTFLYRQTPLPR